VEDGRVAGHDLVMMAAEGLIFAGTCFSYYFHQGEPGHPTTVAQCSFIVQALK